MIKLFFITFFIAELIITFAIIKKIYCFDKKVNDFNNKVTKSKKVIRKSFFAIRQIIQAFNESFLAIRALIRQKRKEYILKFLKTSALYGGFFCLKGKYKRLLLGYEFAREVYESFKESY